LDNSWTHCLLNCIDLFDMRYLCNHSIKYCFANLRLSTGAAGIVLHGRLLCGGHYGNPSPNRLDHCLFIFGCLFQDERLRQQKNDPTTNVVLPAQIYHAHGADSTNHQFASFWSAFHKGTNTKRQRFSEYHTLLIISNIHVRVHRCRFRELLHLSRDNCESVEAADPSLLPQEERAKYDSESRNLSALDGLSNCGVDLIRKSWVFAQQRRKQWFTQQLRLVLNYTISPPIYPNPLDDPINNIPQLASPHRPFKIYQPKWQNRGQCLNKTDKPYPWANRLGT